MHNSWNSRTVRRRPDQGGFTIIEVMFGAAILLVALLGHMSASWTAGELSKSVRSRSEGLRFAQQFVERLRTEEDFVNLYTRLHTLRRASAALSVTLDGGQIVTSADTLSFNDGSMSLPPQAYFADFADPPDFDKVGVLVEVPFTAFVSGQPVLREDAVAPEFGLPADLDGDSMIDGADHAADYRALPIIVRIRYVLEGEQPYETRIVSWLRGER